METAINIVKIILLPILEKDKQYSAQKSTSEFWEQFTHLLLDFENDAKPVYALIYSLELADAEKIIHKLPKFYIAFSNELAENYVLNQNSEASDYLISTNNQTFLDQVQFYKTLRNVVKKVERKRIKQALPNLYEKLNFELSETYIANATKKKGREDLKSKMKVWEEELNPQKRGMIFYSLPNEKKAIPKQKVISLSWIKYAVAASLLIGFMILQPTRSSNDELFASYSSSPSSFVSIDYSKLENTANSSDTRGSEYILKNYSLSETETAFQAIKLFNARDFENAKMLFMELSPKEKNTELLVFLAITQLNTNDVSKAISNLEFLHSLQKYSYSDEVEFHLAMAYIKVGKINEAKSLLKYQIEKDGKYTTQSSSTLKKLRWF